MALLRTIAAVWLIGGVMTALVLARALGTIRHQRQRADADRSWDDRAA